jgi:hypothetical protein
VLVGGALAWEHYGHTADARAAGLWLVLPAAAIQQVTFDHGQARGAVVVENQETFEAALRAGVGRDLVVVWGSGYVGDAEVALLRSLSLPVGVFADLDPDGIAIVADVARRTGLPVRPLLMQPAFLDEAAAVPATPAQRAMAARLAGQLECGQLAELVELANAIAAGGRVREQETLHDRLAELRSV